MFNQFTRKAVVAAAALATTFTFAACGDSDESGSAGNGEQATVKVALDWTPNTNHIGLYVAQNKGWFADENIQVKFLPYAETLPETLVDKGTADVGVSYQAGVAYAAAAGQDVKQIYATVQKSQYAIGVRADSAIRSPKDLDGKTYAGFGTPDEQPMLQSVIRADGGKGEFKSVALDTAAYEAVYSKRADFMISVQTWDGVEAGLSDKPVRYFNPSDYGFPEQYSTALAASDKWLKADPERAKGFLAAVAKGYAFAAENPAEAADILVKENPQTLKNPELVKASAQKLADGDYFVKDGTPIGTISDDIWSQYGGFLVENKLLAGPGGKPITSAPDWSTYFTNEYLPQD